MLRIALTTRVTHPQGYAEPRDSLAQDWTSLLDGWGMLPLLVPNTLANPAGWVTALVADLLILTGGEDLGSDESRDRTEQALLEHALSTGLSVLAVCRGLQLVNRHFGGTLERVKGHVASRHSVRVVPEWQDLLGAEPQVNSYHNWAIPPHGLGRGLRSVACDPEGHVEAFTFPGIALLAVMWHPERPIIRLQDRELLQRLAAKDLP
ncbi:putative glutamine amidotransferase [Magnetospirillum gryphiswaldense MSR-1 v2]|uniref:Glutamine amidotransferase n=1 Tax=Magnetospirillum gryphiswaldense (strain DSM 6361 / JCM 21280 / NBRC 15271 / MSR-1) TaxID=431944 RepID=V6F824_MAGGM|nr:gamma-glutamyl-gamma-aminobutyrate hydrolase family protein [Magnetospirillum gryphiswaldense]CDL00643.1 putative glutamine amidotransferase [Magnetospirillum gryphiswaldense MSR-1 v2]